MDKKYLCLFNKNEEQLKKELKRRGIFIPPYEYSTQRAIAEIIYKDAFDCGKDFTQNTSSPQIESETTDYLLTSDWDNNRYQICLTDEQKAFWDWLEANDILPDTCCLETWDKDVIKVGRIK